MAEMNATGGLPNSTDTEEEETGALSVLGAANVREAMKKRSLIADERKKYYDDLAQKTRERREGPSFSERMYQLSSAFFAPTTTRGFSGVAGNVLPVLAAQQKAQREGEIKREDALSALAAAQLAQSEGLAEQAVDTEIELAKLANKRRPIGFNPVTGVKEYMDEITPAAVGAAPERPKTEIRGGVEGTFNQKGEWTPLPYRPTQETFRDATPEEAAARGAKSGQVSNLTGLFKPDPVAKPRELKPKEIQMLTDAEQAIASGEQAVRDFSRALELNPTAYSGGLATTRAAIGSVTSSSDPAYLATEEYANLTTQNALNALKTTFGSNPTEGERKILLEVQGSVGKPPAVRERILRRAMGVAQRVIERNKAMIPKIQGGYYSTRTDGSQGKPASKPRVINWNN
jgi:hypothetical protein